MSITYTPTTNFGAKDGLPANDTNKVVKGAEFTTEFTAIQSALALAAPASTPTFTGTATFDDLTVTGDLAATLTTAAQPSITSVGKLTGFESTGIDDNANAVAITINSSEEVGIGGIPRTTLTVHQTVDSSADGIRLTRSDESHAWTQYMTGSSWNLGYALFSSSDPSTPTITATSLGDVGIGTNAPRAKLDVDGDIRLSGNASALQFEKLDGSPDNALYYDGAAGGVLSVGRDADALHLRTGGSNRVYVDSTGHVGVGISTPSAALHVSPAEEGTGDQGPVSIKLGNSNSSGRSAEIIKDTTAPRDLTIRASTSAADPENIVFELDANTEAMRIDSVGRIGIGTKTPSAALDVESEIHVNDPASTNPLRITQTGANAEVVNGAAGDIELGLANDGDIHFVNGVAKNKRVTIDVNGDVGLGTIAPDTKLHMSTAGAEFCTLRMDAANTINASYSLRSHDGVLDIRDNNASATRMTIDSTGDVGIGVVPTQALDVGGTVHATGAFRGTAATGAGTPTFSFVADQDTGMYNEAADKLGFSTGGTSRMVIDSSGHVGIGVADPGTSVLAVKGTTPFGSGLRVFSDDAASNWARIDLANANANDTFILYQDQAGNVGIRNDVTSPATGKIMTFVAGNDVTGGMVFETKVGTAAMSIKSTGAMNLTPLASAPSGPTAGELYFDSSTNKLRCYDGTIWNDCF